MKTKLSTLVAVAVASTFAFSTALAKKTSSKKGNTKVETKANSERSYKRIKKAVETFSAKQQSPTAKYLRSSGTEGLAVAAREVNDSFGGLVKKRQIKANVETLVTNNRRDLGKQGLKVLHETIILKEILMNNKATEVFDLEGLSLEQVAEFNQNLEKLIRFGFKTAMGSARYIRNQNVVQNSTSNVAIGLHESSSMARLLSEPSNGLLQIAQNWTTSEQQSLMNLNKLFIDARDLQLYRPNRIVEKYGETYERLNNGEKLTAEKAQRLSVRQLEELVVKSNPKLGERFWKEFIKCKG